MNTETGYITKDPQEIEVLQEELTLVPNRHQRRVNKILGSKTSGYADMTENNSLVKWAKNQKKKKMARKSRQTNRRK